MNKSNVSPQAEAALHEDDQYSLGMIVGIWALAAAPMVLFAFVVAPAVSGWLHIPTGTPAFLVFWPFMIIGLVWQCILSLIIVRRECGNIHWSTIKERMWYSAPRDPKTGRKRYWLLLWTIPFIVLSYASQQVTLPDIVGTVFPFAHHLPVYNLGVVISPEYEGAWWLLGLTLLTIPFNYFLGEEFLFRGILLPKMKGVFGRWDWFFNGVFFGLYHLHKPFGIPHQILFSGLILSLPAKIFRSNWMAVVIHGTEAFVATRIILLVVLGKI